MKKVKVLLACLFSLSVFATEPFCKDVQGVKLCFNDRVDTVFSPECKDLDCDIVKHKIKNLKIFADSQFGNPIYGICPEISGKTITKTIKHKGKSRKIELCKVNESYMDLGTLYFLYRRKYEN
jgi:hypothetical protein